MKRALLRGSIVAAVWLSQICSAQSPVALFNGKDLSGWVAKGGKARFTVDNGELVGTAVSDTSNSFLCTEQVYTDFVFECDFKVAPQLNSGVQFRSECARAAAPEKAEQRVYGYQAEIDVDPKKNRWWTAGIYDEARRGWLYPGPKGGQAEAFTEQGRKVSKAGEWNHLRIEAKGDVIKTFLNGAPRAELKDKLSLRGFIGLQVHGIGKDKRKEGLQVRWRNLTLVDLSGKSN